MRRLSLNKSLPRRVSFETLCEILVGYLNAGAADKCRVSMTEVSRNNRFFKSWGFIEESPEKRKYKLVPEIAQFASAYRIDPEGDQTRQTLKDFLTKNEIINKFIERIKKESLDRNTVLASLPRLTGDLRADEIGLSTFMDMLTYAFNLEEMEVPIKRPIAPTERIKRKRERVSRGLPMFYPPVILSIPPDISLEKFKRFIQAFYEAYDEYLQKKTSKG